MSPNGREESPATEIVLEKIHLTFLNRHLSHAWIDLPEDVSATGLFLRLEPDSPVSELILRADCRS